MVKPAKTLSDHLEHIASHESKHISVGRIARELEEGSLAVLMFLFALPPGLPIPATGIGTVLGWPVLFASVQLLMGRNTLWLPGWIASKRISMSIIRKAIRYIQPIMEKFEHIIRPRLLVLSRGIGQRLFGLVCVICSLSVLLPLPLTNTIPSAGIAIMALGLLERDGLIMLGGMVVGLLGCTVAVLGLVFGIEFFQFITEWIKGLTA